MPPLSQVDTYNNSRKETRLLYETDEGRSSATLSSVEMDATVTKFDKKKSKSVTFASSDETFDIPNIYLELCLEERKKLWMTEEDLKANREECRRTFEKWSELDDDDDGDVLCTRGLEKFLRANCIRRKKARNHLYGLVWDVQALQVSKGIPLHDILAKLCQACSVECRRDAQVTGVRDAFAVRILGSRKDKHENRGDFLPCEKKN